MLVELKSGTDIAELNLRCALGLPGVDEIVASRALDALDEWTEWVELGTTRMLPKYFDDKVGVGRSEAEARVMILLTVLQRSLGIGYNFEFMRGEYDASDPRDLFIHGPLLHQRGTCVNLPILVIAIGRRLGYPLYAVATSGHCFCRWQDENETFNFDAAGRGFHSRGDDYYRTWPKPVSDDDVRRNAFLKNWSPEVELANFLVCHGLCLLEHRNYLPAVVAFRKAYQLAPDLTYLKTEWEVASAIYRLVECVQRLRECDDGFSDLPVVQGLQRAARELPDEIPKRVIRKAIEDLARVQRNRLKRAHNQQTDTVFHLHDDGLTKEHFHV